VNCPGARVQSCQGPPGDGSTAPDLPHGALQ
jgi:hypothetical protein